MRAPRSRRLKSRKSFVLIFGLVSVLVLGAAIALLYPKSRLLTKEQLALILGESPYLYRFPSEILIPTGKNNPSTLTGKVQYTFDSKLQDEMKNLFSTYRPDYGAFVALDATTGRVLSLVSYSHLHPNGENLALKATFPAASVFKVVTAAAAIEGHKFTSDTIIPFNGSNHTLYKGNILRDHITRWTRKITLKDAFAKSVNTVFGKIGAYSVGPEDLRNYASRFGFNRRIAADFPIGEGRANIPQDPTNHWGIAESASGYTRETTMSPLQGALIASAIVNSGLMMEPYMVQSVHTDDGKKVYSAEPKLAGISVDGRTANEVRELMRQTVASGTSRRTFSRFFKRDMAHLDVGGKTGSLTGTEPKGKYDWFVGYADNGPNKIAFAALTIHERFWTVKSSYLVRRAIELYFKDKPVRAQVASK